MHSFAGYMLPNKFILPVIVFAQFCCTSLWFASNGVLSDLMEHFDLQASVLGHITSMVQFGFISGTLIFAVLSIADRFSPSIVFFVCGLLGAFSNFCVIWDENNLLSLLLLRFFTGFFLAGIYPVGMKIAADYFEKGLGKSLGFLVGALVVGTAFPHLLKGGILELSWKYVLLATSALAVFGGSLILIFIPDGPYRKAGNRLNLSAFFNVFKETDFRKAASGYFGHMWELYAFWTFIPVMLSMYEKNHAVHLNIPVWSFVTIAIGGFSCVIAGYLSQVWGSKRIAFIALLLSGLCCVISPLMFTIKGTSIFIIFLLFWGMVVIADSPLFSTLVAHNAPSEIKGTALTIVNCIGFAITIVSIQLINKMVEWTDSNFIFVLLAIGPFLGLIAIRGKEILE